MIIKQTFNKVNHFFDSPLIKIWVFSLLLKLFLVFNYKTIHNTQIVNILDIVKTPSPVQWYHDDVDYPPLFMYLQHIISLFTPEKIEDSQKAIVYRKLSVTILDFIFVSILNFYSKEKYNLLISASIILNPCVFLLDNIYFDYNVFVYGFLALSIIYVQKKSILKAAFIFTISIFLNKDFVCLVPCFLVVFVRSYCLRSVKFKFKTYLSFLTVFKWNKIMKLALVISSAILLSFFPFFVQKATVNDFKEIYFKVYPKTLLLINEELSPSNVWTLYSLVDSLLTQLFKYFNKLNKFKYFAINKNTTLNEANDLINGKNVFNALPDIEPKINFYFIAFYQSLAIIPLFFNYEFKRFIGSLTLCCYTTYLFGRNIKSTDILLVMIPFTFLVIFDKRLLTPFMLLTSSGFVSLFPIISSPEVFMMKLTYTTIWMIIFYLSFNSSAKNNAENRRVWFFDRLSLIYIVSLFPMIIFCGILNTFEFKSKKYKQIALLIYNCYCSLGIITSWFGLSWLYNFDEHMWT